MAEQTFENDIEDHMGFIRVLMGRGEPSGELAQFLSATLAQWIEQHPQVRILSVVPINRDGDIVELHAWFESRFLFSVVPTSMKPDSTDDKC